MFVPMQRPFIVLLLDQVYFIRQHVCPDGTSLYCVVIISSLSATPSESDVAFQLGSVT